MIHCEHPALMDKLQHQAAIHEGVLRLMLDWIAEEYPQEMHVSWLYLRIGLRKN